MLVIGGGATGMQVASIFNAFGCRVELFETGPRILAAEDEDVAAAVAAGCRKAGIVVHENFGAIDSFEKTSIGARMNFSKEGKRYSAEAALAVVAAGWVANTRDSISPRPEFVPDNRGFVKVDEHTWDLGIPYLRRGRRDWSTHARSACHTGGLRGGD